MPNRLARLVVWAVVLTSLAYAFDFSGDEKLKWIFSDNGLEKPYDVQNFFTFNNKLYVLINPQKTANFNQTANCCYTKSGVFEWNDGNLSWTYLMPRVSPYGSTDVLCTNTYCYVARNELFKFVPAFNGTYTQLPEPKWNIDNIELRNGKIYSMGGTGNNDVQVFDTANEAAGWLELSSIADPIPETYAGGSQYLTATNDGAVYTVSAFVKKVYRWSPKLTIWHDVTYDLDIRNQLGACCGPLGRIRASSNGQEVYVSTEQGISWFRGDAWQKLTEHWGNKDFWVFDNYLFSEGNRYELPGLLSAVSYDMPNTYFTNMFSPNGGETVFSEIWNVTGSGGDSDRTFLGIARFTFPVSTGVLDLTTSAGFTRSLSVDYASYFGSTGEDDAIAAFVGEMSGAEVVIFVANFNTTPSGISSNLISNIGWGTSTSNGYVVVANAVTGAWIKAARVGSSISSADQSRQTKRIALTLAEGILILSADLSTVVHKIDTPNDQEYKIAMATNDYFAVLAINTSAPSGFPQTNLFLYDDGGQQLAVTDVSNNGVFSLEISSEENKVFVGGYNQIDPDLQLATLRAYKIDPPLEWAWKTFTHTLQELKDAGLTADTRVYHLFYEPTQGYLYYLAESAGPVSVVTRNGFDINKRIDVQTDLYTQPWSMKGAPHLLNYGKINPDNGQLLMSQYTFPRIPSTAVGNTMNAKDASFFVSSDGKVYVAGAAACCIPGRDLSRLNCQEVGPYAGDVYLLIVNSDFTRRLLWTPFGAGGIGRGVAIGTDHVTVLFETSTNKTENVIYTTEDAQFGARINVASSDLHFLTFKLQQEIRNCTAQFLQDSLSFNNPDEPTRNPLVYPYAPWVSPVSPRPGTSTAQSTVPFSTSFVLAAQIILMAVLFNSA